MKINYLNLSILFAFLLLVGCNNVSKPKLGKTTKHVILVGFDGLSASSIRNGADMPTLRSLMETGSYTLENRSVLPSSSAVNWASMFMGAGPEIHGYTEWGSKVPELPSRVVSEHNIFPDVFAQVRKIMPEAELGYFFEWNGMRYLVDSLSFNCFKQQKLSGDNITEAIAPAVDYIKTKKPTICALIFDQPDGIGHSIGWESPEYFAKIHQLDKALAEIVKAVDEAGIREETLIIVTADHGGVNKGHGGKSMIEMQTPIVFNGKDIKPNFIITESTMVYDLAGTIGAIFGIEQPQAWISRPIRSAFK